MPRWGRTSAHVDRVKQWSDWVTPLIDASGMSGAEIERESARYADGQLDRMISRDLVSKWRNAVHGATPSNATMIARILSGRGVQADPIDALHHAGYDSLIEDILAFVKAHDDAKRRGEDPLEKYRAYTRSRGDEPDSQAE